jgi:hypothetical protein
MVILRTAQIFASPYHPQCNGAVERFNRTLNNLLSHYVNERQDDWDLFLPLLSHAYNTTYSPRLRNTPFFLAHGFAPTTTLLFTPTEHSVPSNSVFGEEARAAARTAQSLAIQHIIRNQFNSSVIQSAANDRKPFTPFKVGDHVMVLDPATPTGLRGKYIRRWKDGYRILTIQNDNSTAYTVERIRTGRTRRVHFDFMKLAYGAFNNNNTHAPTTSTAHPDEEPTNSSDPPSTIQIQEEQLATQDTMTTSPSPTTTTVHQGEVEETTQPSDENDFTPGAQIPQPRVSRYNLRPTPTPSSRRQAVLEEGPAC